MNLNKAQLPPKYKVVANISCMDGANENNTVHSA